MTRRIFGWIPGVTRSAGKPTVHFHRGSQLQPAVCFDERCAIPRLDPEA